LVYRVTLPTYVPPGRFDRFELVGRIFGHENDDRQAGGAAQIFGSPPHGRPQ
jgi:hypothetical protein